MLAAVPASISLKADTYIAQAGFDEMIAFSFFQLGYALRADADARRWRNCIFPWFLVIYTLALNDGRLPPRRRFLTAIYCRRPLTL